MTAASSCFLGLMLRLRLSPYRRRCFHPAPHNRCQNECQRYGSDEEPDGEMQIHGRTLKARGRH